MVSKKGQSMSINVVIVAGNSPRRSTIVASENIKIKVGIDVVADMDFM